jgi:hypothetical protein
MISSVDAVVCLATHPSPLLIFEMKFREILVSSNQ